MLLNIGSRHNIGYWIQKNIGYWIQKNIGYWIQNIGSIHANQFLLEVDWSILHGDLYEQYGGGMESWCFHELYGGGMELWCSSWTIW
ncbi:hypothetical protein CEXT_44061 [Caerostris extrusa]|uniref:Uncharacterized protein n=1 Tax=Caerostris extrusa TaxID=172846 RepID=A0AAV4XCP2_CAEEX|nr:hypothetical protein CEXT_44061 [Caerostris extrusa]